MVGRMGTAIKKKEKTIVFNDEAVKELERVQVNLGIVNRMMEKAYTPSLISILNNNEIRVPYEDL